MDRPGVPTSAAEPTAAVRSWDRPAVILPVLAVLSVIGGQLPSFSARATLYVLAAGAALIWLGRSARQRPRAASRPVGVPAARWWLLPASVFGAVELATLLTGGPTISLLADPLLAGEAGRSLGWFGWLCAFWWLVRR